MSGSILAKAILLNLDLDLIARFFEAGMLICFGCSWPAAILKTVRVKRVDGKSIHFLFLVFIGYMCGITFRILTSIHAGEFNWILLLYFALAGLVLTEILLYFRYSKTTPSAEDATLPPVE